ncbi:DUF1659 domain-containing protein [Staphylococcus sp. SQ8-PEA]|uniref:DUF1659 domain-containing protein n=1 Tax=Staphylococcus marylandisciuri TaxID=2981529 RepID=A0ABT2QSD3_9STAP|nr:DUF1659 domain-containing protein [Staphylococcus marylandisciuri]MCU5746895.1 DUF1659 domain-containing protein [Staphylococcus marylandisciuri]
MNTITVSLVKVTHNAEGKAVTTRRRFNNLNQSATQQQIKEFSAIIEQLTGEKYDSIELTTTSNVY